MKRLVPVMVVLALVCAVSVAQAAPKKPNQGQCVSDCVREFNKGFDKSKDAYVPENFAQKECSAWCKNEYVPGDGYFWADGVCNEKHFKEDPDCEAPPSPSGAGTVPLGQACSDDLDCMSGNCSVFKVCSPKNGGF